MAAYFFDTSALVKRYARETGTKWMISLFRRAREHRFYAAHITRVETIAALARKERGAHLTPAEFTRAWSRFEREFTNRFVIIEVTPKLLESAAVLARKHYLRGYDAVQFAAALDAHTLRVRLKLPALTLVTADKDLLIAASKEGLSTDNPENH